MSRDRRSRTFKHSLAAHLAEVRQRVSKSAYDAYVMYWLLADDGHLSPEAQCLAADLLSHGKVGYDVLHDGTVRVWYREARK